jgi:hypothetical protein
MNGFKGRIGFTSDELKIELPRDHVEEPNSALFLNSESDTLDSSCMFCLASIPSELLLSTEEEADLLLLLSSKLKTLLLKLDPDSLCLIFCIRRV